VEGLTLSGDVVDAENTTEGLENVILLASFVPLAPLFFNTNVLS
jgi:hypothetical protein